ncbi:MAG: GTPase HflX [Prochlorothrix sp.]
METIYGKLTGLKPSQLKQIQRLYHQRLPGDRLTTSEFGQRLAAISTEIKQPLSVYLNRRGQVLRVGVGTPRQTQFSPLELPRYGAERLCGIRCITTDLKANPPGKGTLTAMALQRLDALVCVGLSGQGFTRRGGTAAGYVRHAYVAHLLPQVEQVQATDPWRVWAPLSLEDVAEQDFLDLVEGLEEEFRRESGAQAVDFSHDRVLIVGLETADWRGRAFEQGVAEVERLVESAGGEVLEVVRQRRDRPHPQTVIGDGKVEEVALSAQTLGANLIVFDRDLSPAQGRNMERRIGLRVVDRTQVILDIFAQRAQTRAGKLQVELAQLEYSLPRLTGRGQAMSRLGGGIGTRGPGETKLETERRTIQQRISRLQRDVNQLQAHRARMRHQRQHQQVPTVALVGYTNAGKSTLLNSLTAAQVYAADQLFATLDPTTRRLVLPPVVTTIPTETSPSETVPIATPPSIPVQSPAPAQTQAPIQHQSPDPDLNPALDPDPDPVPSQIQHQTQGQTLLVTDTVGFIHGLPPALVDAFRATLEEVTEADALVHVVDLSHAAWEAQIESVNEILAEMPLPLGPMLLVFNKVDIVSSEALARAQEQHPQAVFVSATDRLGWLTLQQRLSQLVLYTQG